MQRVCCRIQRVLAARHANDVQSRTGAPNYAEARCEQRQSLADATQQWWRPLGPDCGSARQKKTIVYLDSLGWAPDGDVIGLTQQLLEDADEDASGHTGHHQWQDWSEVMPKMYRARPTPTRAACTSAGTPAPR